MIDPHLRGKRSTGCALGYRIIRVILSEHVARAVVYMLGTGLQGRLYSWSRWQESFGLLHGPSAAMIDEQPWMYPGLGSLPLAVLHPCSSQVAMLVRGRTPS